MPLTFWDMSQVDRHASWRLIRELRSADGLARADRLTFTTALEQAQQLFEAAESVGTATRALPLYYGLNQACRAIACAIRPGATFESHGLTTNERSVRGKPPRSTLDALTVQGNGARKSGWTVMSDLLGSAAMHEEQPIRHLWGMVVETQVHPPRYPAEHPSLFVQEDRQGWLVTGIAVGSEHPGMSDFAHLQLGYPALLDTTFGGFSDPRTQPDGRRTWNLAVGAQSGSPGPLGTRYREGWVLMPAVKGEAATLHPLALWWAVLYPLSILSRYEPATWSALVDVNASPAAVHLEALMDEALDALPALIHQALARGLGQETKAGSG